MLDFSYSPKFKKDIKQAAYRGRDIMKMFSPIAMLLNNRPLPRQYRDHPLKGEWTGYRDFHVEPDWIVIYRIVGNLLVLEQTGTHSELFGK
ncbi:MAG: type II toxin-antitoxin system YafQ family toxin [Synergistaceae bacterium]|jgi:mRNA interferase YafQ|nr:type II toxin-antitoxin system YafQ family toxin [Synergistaceae bacterium]